MLKDLLGILFAHPEHAATICSVFLAALLISLLAKKLVKDFNSFESRLAQWEISVSGHMSETRRSLAHHSDDLGKATKAINGDMQKIKESVFELKQDLLSRIESMREIAGHLERQVKMLAVAVKTTTERFEEKYGKIVELRQALDEGYGKIIRLEGSAKSVREELIKHEEWFRKIAKTLTDHKDDLSKIKKEHL